MRNAEDSWATSLCEICWTWRDYIHVHVQGAHASLLPSWEPDPPLASSIQAKHTMPTIHKSIIQSWFAIAPVSLTGSLVVPERANECSEPRAIILMTKSFSASSRCAIHTFVCAPTITFHSVICLTDSVVVSCTIFSHECKKHITGFHPLCMSIEIVNNEDG